MTELHVSAAALADAREIFDMYAVGDAREERVVPKARVATLLRALGVNTTQCAQLIDNVVTTTVRRRVGDAAAAVPAADGGVTLDAFLDLYRQCSTTVDAAQELREVFEWWDRAGHGYVNCSQMRTIVRAIGTFQDPNEVDRLVGFCTLGFDLASYERVVGRIVAQQCPSAAEVTRSALEPWREAALARMAYPAPIPARCTGELSVCDVVQRVLLFLDGDVATAAPAMRSSVAAAARSLVAASQVSQAWRACVEHHPAWCGLIATAHPASCFSQSLYGTVDATRSGFVVALQRMAR